VSSVGATAEPNRRRRGLWHSVALWFDSWAVDVRDGEDPRRVDWTRVVPFFALHASCLLVLVVGWSWTAVAFAAGFYLVRMFGITAFYHRYFSHRAFRTSRAMQFAFALLCATAVQRGPLWWAAHHRREGFWWSHVGWILARVNFTTRKELVPDLLRFPELRFLDRFDSLVPLLLIPAIWGLGEALAAAGLGGGGLQLLVWGFAISTVALYHLTFCVNSVAHRLGSRRFETGDQSRNNALLSLFTLGEGWHNNHHYYPNSVRQGFYWWELDLSYYVLRGLAALGLVWDLRPVPARVLAEGRRK
jgi:stearoyl-CoA desaturase (delta-9 desaturase)